ncbi:universal stress protein, partial [Staphylococcus hominis]|nr:universal stress protein [Staphylococcus hominis]
MYKNILLGVDTQLKNDKALKEISKLAGPDTV